MKRALIMSALLATALTGCQSSGGGGNAEAVPAVLPETDARMMECNIPDAAVSGPITTDLYVVGAFSDSNWIHIPSRKLHYKGNGLYQVITKEKPSEAMFQFAAMSWSPQFTISGLDLAPGQVARVKGGGIGTDTAVTFTEAGDYVWSLRINGEKKPVDGSVVLCK